MDFASLDFLLFMVIVYGLYTVLPWRGQNAMLLVASYVFYGFWDWRFLGLIAFSTVVDFVVGKCMGDTEDPVLRKRLVVLSLVMNLGLLGVFKYFNFFVASAEDLAALWGLKLHWTTTLIVLPVGISFYTFQTLSYTLDIYRGHLKPTRNLLDFALFVSFFPQLVAGPIERASHLLPEVTTPRRVRFDDVTRGLFLIMLGLFKKVAIADGVAGSVNAIYNSSTEVGGADVVLATYLFAIQIFCDFSGYTDIARGLAKTLGFNLMNNFDQPYIATNPQDFWRRWHISLSTWLRDYLYVPLGGNRGGPYAVYRNLMITMVLGGLWHGAAWNFVAWGAFHGGILAIHRRFAGRERSTQSLHTPAEWAGWALRVFLFFHVTCYGWLLFRANSMGQVVDFTRVLLTGWAHGLSVHVTRPPLAALLGIAVLTALAVAKLYNGSPRFYRAWPAPLRGGLVAVLFVAMLMGLSGEPAQFIYFQF